MLYSLVVYNKYTFSGWKMISFEPYHLQYSSGGKLYSYTSEVCYKLVYGFIHFILEIIILPLPKSFARGILFRDVSSMEHSGTGKYSVYSFTLPVHPNVSLVLFYVLHLCTQDYIFLIHLANSPTFVYSLFILIN